MNETFRRLARRLGGLEALLAFGCGVVFLKEGYALTKQAAALLWLAWLSYASEGALKSRG